MLHLIQKDFQETKHQCGSVSVSLCWRSQQAVNLPAWFTELFISSNISRHLSFIRLCMGELKADRMEIMCKQLMSQMQTDRHIKCSYCDQPHQSDERITTYTAAADMLHLYTNWNHCEATTYMRGPPERCSN